MIHCDWSRQLPMVRHLRVIRELQAGEELLASYIDPLFKREERQQLLQARYNSFYCFTGQVQQFLQARYNSFYRPRTTAATGQVQQFLHARYNTSYRSGTTAPTGEIQQRLQARNNSYYRPGTTASLGQEQQLLQARNWSSYRPGTTASSGQVQKLFRIRHKRTRSTKLIFNITQVQLHLFLPTMPVDRRGAGSERQDPPRNHRPYQQHAGRVRQERGQGAALRQNAAGAHWKASTGDDGSPTTGTQH